MEEIKNENTKTKTLRKGYYMASEHGSRGVNIPDYWRKKKLKWEFFEELEKAAKSEPVAKDEYGEYRVGVFLYKTAVVFVEFKDGMWRCSVRSEHAVSPVLATEIRYKFIPDRCAMAILLLPREESKDPTVMTMYEIPPTEEEGDGAEESEGQEAES